MNIRVSIIAAVAIATATPANAHHSFAMFDTSKEVELANATVIDWQWTSPHTWLYVIVPNGKGQSNKYTIEGGNPGLLRRQGFSKGSIKAGDKITVYMSPLKNGEKGGAFNAILLANGELLGERLKQ